MGVRGWFGSDCLVWFGLVLGGSAHLAGAAVLCCGGLFARVP
jgi:hypothetical protein